MELRFEVTTSLGAGINPAAIHLPDNSVYLFAVDGGRLKAKSWRPLSGDVNWALPDFNDPITATLDKALSLYRIKNVPRVGMFGAWHQDATEKTAERQRIGIWDALNDLTNYLQSGSVQLDLDNIVSSATFTFKNPSGRLSGEDTSRLAPGKKVELLFTAGDSEDYPMGVFYVDRVSMDVNGETASVDCRNISGKLLKDQKMDGQNYYPKDVYAYIVEDLLTAAGIADFDVQQPDDPLTAWQAGLSFPPDMDMLTALNEMIKISLNWVVRETLDGQLIAGSTVTYDTIKDLNSKYTFDRGTDVISRGIIRDDDEVYSKICYQSRNTTTESMVRYYVNVNHDYEWAFAPHKTLYVDMPDDTSLAELTDLANELATRMSGSGIMEQFTGPFRPHIIPGDEAEIVTPGGSNLLGLITTVEHTFGEDGFFTSFTVDSGGAKGKPQLKELINRTTKTVQDGVRRLE